jgi:excinuclease ABC subunit B
MAAEDGGDEYLPPQAVPRKIETLEKEMMAYAKNFEFEKAAELRDKIRQLRDRIKSPT